MKVAIQLFALAISLTVFTSMSTLSNDFTGTWVYETSTPEGDYTGDMIIEKTAEGYTGHLLSEGNKIDLKNVMVEDETLSFNMYANGYYLKVKFKHDEAGLKGNIYVEGEMIPITAKAK